MQSMKTRLRSATAQLLPMPNMAVCLFFAVLGVLSTCGVLWCQKSMNPAGTLRRCFVVVPGATETGHSTFLGKDQLWYRVQASYPAADVLRIITGRLKTMGWTALEEDWLNSGLPSSHVRGWVYYEDHATQPTTSVRVWQGDWQNGAHDILTYRLEYRCPDNLCASTRDLNDLRVIAIYTPAKLAKQMKSSGSGKRTDR